jgi:carbamoyl-phosphate synthase large subunit
MTGAGAPGAAGIIQCLKMEPFVELTVADANENAIGKYLANRFIRIPQADDPDFTEAVLQHCLDNHIQLILPLVTRELFPLSKNKNRFEEKGIRVLVSPEEAINRANNKSACYQFLKERGIEVPQFSIVHTVEEFIDAARQMGYPQKQFCFKPSFSNGSRGVRVVSAFLDEADQLFNQKPYQLYMGYEQAVKVLGARPFPELLVSAYLPGPEYSVDCLAYHGKAELVVPRVRTKMINGISVEGEFMNDEAIVDYCGQIIEAIGLHGNIGIQVKISEEGQPLLLEINPRVQGTIVAALGAGVNLPLLAVKRELDLGIEPRELEIKLGTRFSRHWTEVFY